jgi:hypothetical protein
MIRSHVRIMLGAHLINTKNMKNIIQKIINFFKSLRSKAVKDLELLTIEYDKLFNHDLFKPEIEFTEYLKSLGKENLKISTEWNMLHDEYYNKYYKCQYQANRLRILSLEPKLLTAFLNEFSSIDYQKIHDYMVNVNWTYKSRDKLPTIDELKDTIISLIPTKDYYSENNEISTGGFSVNLYYDKDKNPVCKIIFSYNY